MPKNVRKKRSGVLSREMAILAIAGGIVLLLIVGALVVFNSNQPESIDISQIPDEHDEQGIPYPAVPRIALVEAKAKFDAGEAIFLDVRSLEEYQARHIPGAISMPTEEIPARYQELAKDAEIITYCT